MTLYPIFSRRIAYKLEKEGFKVIKIAPNRKKPELKVYYFEETVALREKAREFISEKH
jgi:hypothetical protein